MDCSFSLHKTLTLTLSPPSHLSPKAKFTTTFIVKPRPSGSIKTQRRRSSRSLVAVASASHLESSSLNTPLEPRSPTGKYLSRVLQNQPQLFHVAVAEELKQLDDDRHAAVSRMSLAAGSEEASLHRRIAELKERDCQDAIEDVIYMLVLFKFSEIRVHLVPKLSRCVYNGRLEIWPAKDWELESIHKIEVLEMIREHVSAVIGLRMNASVTDSWATTKIQRVQLGRIYAASILYGYFLKSASLRLQLEQTLALSHQVSLLLHRNSLQSPKMWPYGWNNLVFGRPTSTDSALLSQTSTKLEKKPENLRFYVMGFDPQTLKRCAKVKSRETMSLIEKHTGALFGDGDTGVIGNDEVILTSFSSMKRLVLEAVAFGSFLWDIEDNVNSVYRLTDN